MDLRIQLLQWLSLLFLHFSLSFYVIVAFIEAFGLSPDEFAILIACILLLGGSLNATLLCLGWWDTD